MKIPDTVPLVQAGPLFCAGITMYDPLRYWGALKRKNMKIGVVGIGGLGSLGLKFIKAMGHTAVAIAFSEAKNVALEKGADHFIDSTN